MVNIVVDKSFLQGAAGCHVRDLVSEHRLIMSDALFYELLTTRAESRVQCFRKFPDYQNPVDLVSHAGVLMRHEIETGTPSGTPSNHKEDLKFIFSSSLTHLEYKPPPDAQNAIDEETARLRGAVQSFLEKTAAIASMFPDLFKGSQAERDAAHLEAEAAIVSPKALVPFISQLEPPSGEKPLPPSESIDETWAIYRWVQVQLLFALDVHVRYQGNIPKPLSSNVYEKMGHDVLDAEQLILGCLEGAFATRENKHKRWWRLLCPEGCLYE